MSIKERKHKSSQSKWGALELFSPSIFRPHGLSGMLSVVIGTYITSRTLLGYYITDDAMANGAWERALVHTYITTGIITCLGAMGILRKAPSAARSAFFNTSVIQMALLYVCWRFTTWSAEQPSSTLMHRFVYFNRMNDLIASMAILYVILETIYRVPFKRSDMHWSVRLSILCGLFALSLLSGYPLQLALQGDAWFNAVLAAYPLQRLAFVYYVYIPATFGFHVIVFAATLENRRIIRPKTFGLVIFVFVFGLLVPTVLLQEVYIGCVSTQKLLISSTDDGSVFYGLIPTSALDTSVPAQKFWMFLASKAMFLSLDPATHFRFYQCYSG